MIRMTRVLGLGLLALLLSMASAQAEPLGVGDRVPELSLENQFGDPGKVDSSTTLILFSRDMDGGKILKQALVDIDPDYLAGRNARYVADISGMPSLVAKMFAIPSMKKRPYKMLLDRLGQKTRRLPDIEGQATFIFLKALKITAVEHFETPAAVREKLGLPPLPVEE